jgi:hypothetical protein
VILLVPDALKIGSELPNLKQTENKPTSLCCQV